MEDDAVDVVNEYTNVLELVNKYRRQSDFGLASFLLTVFDIPIQFAQFSMDKFVKFSQKQFFTKKLLEGDHRSPFIIQLSH